jgi:hypothetical protein
VYYEYFRERAASCRRSAEGANVWLADVSLDLADMFDEMAEDVLIRELSRRTEATAVAAGPKVHRPTQPAAAMLPSWRASWKRIGYGRWWGPRPVHRMSAAECI